MEPEVDPLDAIDQMPSDESGGYNVQPFGARERFVMQNFFDTNDAARRQYAKELGYEMDPLDDNLIRPIGSKNDYVEIDPGFTDAYKKGGLKAVAKEVLQDTGDITYDLGDIGTKILAGISSGGGGAATGAAAGSVVPGAGTAAGAVTGGTIAALVGAAAAGAVSNTIKQDIRNMYLDKDIPWDLKETAVDAALTAAGAGAFKLGAKGIKVLKNFNMNRQINGIKNAIKASGGLADPDLIERAAMQPDLFTKEAVDGGAKRLDEAYKGMFGLKPEEFATQVRDFDSIPTESLFGQQIAPLKKLATEETQSLSLNKAADVKYSDLQSKLADTYNNLERLMLSGNPTSEQKEAYTIVKDQMKNLRKMAAFDAGVKDVAKVTDSQLENVSLNYGRAREFLKGFQDAAFVQGPYGSKSTNPIVGGIAGEGRKYLDDVAAKAGSKLPNLNQHMSQIFEDFSAAQTKLTPQSILSAYVGGTTPGARMKQGEIQSFIAGLDEKYGSELAKDFDVTAAQAAFENVYKGAPAKGSSRVNAFMLGEMADQGMRGAMLGSVAGSVLPGVGTGAGAIAGGIGGVMKGAREAAALANPEQGLSKLSELLQRRSAQDALDPVQEAIKGALSPAPAIAGAAASQAGGVQGNEPEEIDPLDLI